MSRFFSFSRFAICNLPMTIYEVLGGHHSLNRLGKLAGHGSNVPDADRSIQ